MPAVETVVNIRAQRPHPLFEPVAFDIAHRDIERRVDDSVALALALPGAEGPVARTTPLRRARGYAPAPLPMPDGFATAPPIPESTSSKT